MMFPLYQWHDTAVLVAGNLPRVHAVLCDGLVSEAHRPFVARLCASAIT
jgi:hypothetical protein